jgi:hypothetical protein
LNSCPGGEMFRINQVVEAHCSPKKPQFMTFRGIHDKER